MQGPGGFVGVDTTGPCLNRPGQASGHFLDPAGSLFGFGSAARVQPQKCTAAGKRSGLDLDVKTIPDPTARARPSPGESMAGRTKDEAFRSLVRWPGVPDLRALACPSARVLVGHPGCAARATHALAPIDGAPTRPLACRHGEHPDEHSYAQRGTAHTSGTLARRSGRCVRDRLWSPVAAAPSPRCASARAVPAGSAGGRATGCRCP
jgi:hypothetical protein